MTKLTELMRMGAAKRTMTLETMGMSKGKTLARLDAVPVELPKVIAQETKKMKYGTVVKLVRVIRSSYVDSKACMERLNEANLGRALLDSLRAMSKGEEKVDKIDFKNLVDKDDQAMESLLSCIGDLFEWDFFAKSDRRLFLEDIFEIIHARYTSPGLLLTEALSVIMTMFTTDNDGVLSELRASRKCLPLFFEIISNMPKTKSFHFQALLVEIVYRILRMLRKSTIKKDQELIQKILESLPPVLSQGIQSVTPKEFRAGTRQLLNQFNQAVGVVQTFPIKGLSFEHKLNKSVPMDEVQWFDMGGMNFEVEIAIRIADEIVQGVAKLHCSNVDGYSIHGKGVVKLHIKNCVALADILPNVNDSEWSDIHGLVVALQVDPSVFEEIVASLKLRFKLIEKQDGPMMPPAIEAQSMNSRAASDATSTSFYELLAKSKQKQPVEAAPVRPQTAEKPSRRVTKKPDISEGSREMKAEQIHDSNFDFKPTTSNKTKNSSRKRPAATNEPVQAPQPSTKPPSGKVKRERQVEPTWEFEQSASRPTNPQKKHKSNEAKSNPFPKPRPSTSPTPSRSRATLSKTSRNTSLGAGQQWKQEPIYHHDTAQHESRRLGLGTRNTVDKEDAVKSFESAKGPRTVPLSNNSRRIPGPGDRVLREKREENEVHAKNQASTMAAGSFLKPNLKTKKQLKAPNEGCDGGLVTANHNKSFDGNGLHAVMDTFDDFASTIKHQHTEYNRVPVSPSDSNASADMDLQSISSSQTSSKSATPTTTVPNHHVISASPHQKKLPWHSQRNDVSIVPSILSPLETQQDLLGKFTDLADAILEQQERYRHNQVQHVVEHNVENFEKSIGEFSNTLRSRLGFGAIGLALEDAVAQHRDQVHAVKHYLDETLSSMHDNEAIDDNLLSDCSALKQLVMQNGRTLMQERMKLLAKKVDSCRTKRKHQMQSKLKEIKDKFNSNDLLAMQALLGRI